MADSDPRRQSSPNPKYAWRLLRAGPLRLDGGSMFGVVPRALWSREVPCDEQGRIELAHNCLLLQRATGNPSSIAAGSAPRTVSPTPATVRSADPTKLSLQRIVADQSSVHAGSALRTVSPTPATTVRSADPTKPEMSVSSDRERFSSAAGAPSASSGQALTGGTQSGAAKPPVGAPAALKVPELSADPATPEWTIIETGSGNKLDAKSRRIFGLSDYWIADALAEAGCRCEDVTHAIVTHLHFDHCGGLTCHAGGEAVGMPTFPNATVYAQRREWEDALVNNSVMTRTYLAENLEPIREQVRLIESPLPFPPGYHPRRDEPPITSPESRMIEILPGIRVLAVPGHTWGQQAVLFTDEQDRTIVFPADLLPTVHHVGAAYNMAYDVEPYTSTVTRRWFLEAAVANDWLLVLDHEPGEPCQRVKRDGKGWFRLEAVTIGSEEATGVSRPPEMHETG